MTRRRQFALVFVGAVALASLVSHAAFRLSGVQTAIPYPEAGTNFHSAPMIAAGSSLLNYATDWEAVAQKFSRHIKVITIPAASPCELEYLQAQWPDANFTLIGIAESDMDENVLSDLRADVVPATRSWRDLMDSDAKPALVQRVMSKYPLRYTRALFPLAGRSMAMMVGIRTVLRNLKGRHGSSESDPLPTFNTGAAWPTNRISDWDPGRTLRNVEVVRQLSGGRHTFSGPKRLALWRMIQWGLARGPVVLVVMPESPLYEKAVINPRARRDFESLVADVARAFPAVKWIRMDQVPAFHSDDCYWDLVHLNADARKVATAKMIQELEPILGRP